MDRIEEIQARLAEINPQLDTAVGDALTALETEAHTLMEELRGLQQTAQRRQHIRESIAAGLTPATVTVPVAATPAQRTAEERAANAFVQTRRMTVDTDQTRAVLISGGQLAQPTEVSGIHDMIGSRVSSFIDLVHIENCEGMGTHRVSYELTDGEEASNQTEGQTAASGSLGTWGYVDITPQSVAVYGQISKQAKKQTPLQYADKVRRNALLALRKKATSVATAALKASTLNAVNNATVDSGKGKVDETTLRKLVLSYGGDESIIGNAILLLNKIDLMAFGDVRGTNEKKAVYEIDPDTANPNMGTIKEGGLSVRYCINSKLTACHGTAQTSTAQPTMFYGSPQCLEVDLFSQYEVRVSEDYDFVKLMDTILGDVELGAAVIVKNGFVAHTIPANP